jgi:predicted amidohydrolase YtcJ
MLEFYQSYATFEDLMTLTEEMFCFIVRNVLGSLELEYQGEKVDFSPPWSRLTIEEAIAAATKDPAWACFEEDIKGTLTPGKLADIAVIDTNLVEAGNENPAALLDSQVLYTIAGGKIVYEGGQ